MAWYWIVLIIIGYFLMGSILSGLVERLFQDEILGVITFIMWPLVLIILPLTLFQELISGKRHL